MRQHRLVPAELPGVARRSTEHLGPPGRDVVPVLLGHAAGEEAGEQVVGLDPVVEAVDQAPQRLVAPGPGVERGQAGGPSLVTPVMPSNPGRTSSGSRHAEGRHPRRRRGHRPDGLDQRRPLNDAALWLPPSRSPSRSRSVRDRGCAYRHWHHRKTAPWPARRRSRNGRHRSASGRRSRCGHRRHRRRHASVATAAAATARPLGLAGNLDDEAAGNHGPLAGGGAGRATGGPSRR